VNDPLLGGELTALARALLASLDHRSRGVHARMIDGDRRTLDGLAMVGSIRVGDGWTGS
jgi:hypothetical protein